MRAWILVLEMCFLLVNGAGTRIDFEANGIGELVVYRALVEIDGGAV